MNWRNIFDSLLEALEVLLDGETWVYSRTPNNYLICPSCGSLVPDYNQVLHTDWHKEQLAIVRLLGVREK